MGQIDDEKYKTAVLKEAGEIMKHAEKNLAEVEKILNGRN